MIVVINAISIKESGSLVVLCQLLRELVALRPDSTWHVATCRHIPALAALDTARVRQWIFPWVERTPLHIMFWYWWTLPQLVRRAHADCLFSQTNYLPGRSLAVPTLLLVQHAGHFSALYSDILERHYSGLIPRLAWRAKRRWVRASVRRASTLTVQTRALANAVIQQTGIPESRVVVVPHGPGLIQNGRARPFPTGGQWRVGYLTMFGVQKNFGVLFLAVNRLLQRGYRIKLILTLRQDTDYRDYIQRALENAAIESYVENLGEIGPDQVQAVYDSLDLFVFPSVCESFGFPMVEAMASGLPTVVADIESSREIAGAGAAYFPPHDADALADRLEGLMTSPHEYESASRRSLARSAEFSWRAAAQATAACLDPLTLAGAVGQIEQSNDQTPRTHVERRTQAHYDFHPFDFLSRKDERTIAEQQPRAFRAFVKQYLVPGQRVADIGCGPGRVTMYLVQLGMDVYALDLSLPSLGLARQRAPQARYICATNLALPIGNGSFDAVVSDGVIHHTPDASKAFRENARLLRDKGYLYLGVYRRYRYYYYLYTYLGAVVRWMHARWWGKRLVNATLLPAYYAVHLVKTRGGRTWRGAKNLFYDYILTPRATFHTYEEVTQWAHAAGMRIVAYDENVGNVHAFVFQKD